MINIIVTTIKPSGFIRKASIKFPFKIETADLVDPQEGQGREVKFLK
nr:hypothetical protein [Paenimyroides tangerinum]